MKVAVAWLCLAFAICFEVLGTSSMKASSGFGNVGWSIIMIISYVLSFTLMTFALESLDLGLAYATWSGVGTTITAIIGVVRFKEEMNLLKGIALTCVIASVVFLQAVTQHSKPQENSNPIVSQPLLVEEDVIHA